MDFWVLVILFLTDGGQSLRGPFTSEVDCIKRGLRPYAEWALSLPEPLDHVSICRPMREIGARLEDLET